MYLRQWKRIAQVFLITQEVFSVGVLFKQWIFIPFLVCQKTSEDHCWETQLPYAVKKLFQGTLKLVCFRPQPSLNMHKNLVTMITMFSWTPEALRKAWVNV